MAEPTLYIPCGYDMPELRLTFGYKLPSKVECHLPKQAGITAIAEAAMIRIFRNLYNTSMWGWTTGPDGGCLLYGFSHYNRSPLVIDERPLRPLEAHYLSRYFGIVLAIVNGNLVIHHIPSLNLYRNG